MKFAKARLHFPRGMTTQLESHLFLCIVGRWRRASIAGKAITVGKIMVDAKSAACGNFARPLMS